MTRQRKMTVSLIVIAAGAILLLGLASMSSINAPGPDAFAVFCNSAADAAPACRWHMAIYLDIKSCLSCTEDMEAWRALESELAACGGTLSLWSPQCDSADVAAAMRLEGMQADVQVLDSGALYALGWHRLGTPVKALLDNQCRLVEIGSRMGNVRESTCFFDGIKAQIRSTGAVASAPD